MSESLSLPERFLATTTEVRTLGDSLLHQKFSADDLATAYGVPSMDRESIAHLDEAEVSLLHDLDQQRVDELTRSKRLWTTIGINSWVAKSFGEVEGFGLKDTYAVMPGTVGLQRVEPDDAYYILSLEGRNRIKSRIVPYVGKLVAAPEGAIGDTTDIQTMGNYLTGYIAPVVTEKLQDVVIPKLKAELEATRR